MDVFFQIQGVKQSPAYRFTSALTEIHRFLHDIRERQRESELLERMGGKHYYTDADISEALKRSKKYKRGQ